MGILKNKKYKEIYAKFKTQRHKFRIKMEEWSKRFNHDFPKFKTALELEKGE